MGGLTQQNAAGAAESASAAEEMNAQAESMKGYLGEPAKRVGNVQKVRHAPDSTDLMEM